MMEIDDFWVVGGILLIIFMSFLAHYSFKELNVLNDFPRTITSGDANSRLSEAENILEVQDARYMPSWFTGESDILFTQPPLNLIIVAVMSGASNVSVFDMFYFSSVIASIGAALCFFVLFSYYFKNKYLGIISAILLIYPIEDFFHYALNVGMFASFSVILFYPIILIFAYRFIKDASFANGFLLALSFGMQFLFHSSEAIIFVLVIGSYFLFFELKNISLKRLCFVGFLFLILISSYFLILYYNFYSGAGNKISFFGNSISVPSHEPQIFLSNFVNPVFYVLLVLSLIVTRKKKEYRLINYVLLLHLFMIFVLANLGLGTYYVSIRMRLIFFIFAYPVIAVGIYYVAQYLSNKFSIKRSVSFGLIIVLLFSYQAYNISGVEPLKLGLYSKENYNGLVWLRDNSDKNSTVLCFGCYQFNGLPSHRVIAQPIYWEDRAVKQMIGLANKSGNQTLYLELSGFADERLFKSGFFKIGMRKALGYHEQDVCSFDYFIFQPYQSFTALFSQISNNLLSKNSTNVYNYGNFVILKNGRKGEDCV